MSSADLIRDVLAAVPLPGLMIDQSERIIAANTGALTLLGQQIVGRHFATILRQPQVLQTIEDSLRIRCSQLNAATSNAILPSDQHYTQTR